VASELIVKVWKIDRIDPIPGADRIVSAVFGGWQTAVKKDQFKAGDLAVYVPPDSVLPGELSDRIGVTKYLDRQRVKAINLLKGTYVSMGLIIENEGSWPEGYDVKDFYGIKKYEPPIRGTIQDVQNSGPGKVKPLKNHPRFFKYSSPQNLRYYPNIFGPEEFVVLTEKIHGSNIRTGLVNGEWMSGSHEVQRLMPLKLQLEHYKGLKRLKILVTSRIARTWGYVHACVSWAASKTWSNLIVRLERFCEPEYIGPLKWCGKKIKRLWNKLGLGKHMASYEEVDKYWLPFNIPEVRNLLSIKTFKDEPCNEIIIYGELYGPGIQKLEYGVKELSFRAFDIRINGKFISYDEFEALCSEHGVTRVPLLYRGPYNSIDAVKHYAVGPTTLVDANHIREGFVIKSAIEDTDPEVGRKILKYIGDQYYAWKDGKDDLDTVDV
jgi:RNA ligase (TIGR02306 family)